jgi:hypothetical protein
MNNQDMECLWLLLKPDRLPRGISSIILAAIYHPPIADQGRNLGLKIGRGGGGSTHFARQKGVFKNATSCTLSIDLIYYS